MPDIPQMPKLESYRVPIATKAALRSPPWVSLRSSPAGSARGEFEDRPVQCAITRYFALAEAKAPSSSLELLLNKIYSASHHEQAKESADAIEAAYEAAKGTVNQKRIDIG